MKFKKIAVLLILIIFSSVIYAEEKSVVYIMDNSYLGENTREYFSKLQMILDNAKDDISLHTVSKYDINTTESLNILRRLKKGNTAVVLKAGEANYYNLYGFSSFKRYHQTNLKNELSSVKDINLEIAKEYGVINKNTLYNAVDTVGKQIFMSKGKIFKPSVIPKFYILSSNFEQNVNIAASLTSYSYAWNLINEGKFNEAYNFLIKIIYKQPKQSMFHYALGSLYLLKKDENYQEKALSAFEEGILVDPFDRDNLCYKGLAVIFMMYEGKIIKEILLFSKLLEKYMPNYSKDISAILAIGNVNYDEKIELINDWIISDMEKIKQTCQKKNIDLILTSYPMKVKSEEVIKKYISDNDEDTSFIEDKINNNESFYEWINNSVRKIFSVLKQKGFINE